MNFRLVLCLLHFAALHARSFYEIFSEDLVYGDDWIPANLDEKNPRDEDGRQKAKKINKNVNFFHIHVSKAQNQD